MTAWGIISTADINRKLIPGAQASPRVDLIAVASRDQRRAEDYAREWGIERAYGSYDALLADADVEAVEKERSRANATQLDRSAKLEDLLRKYSLKTRIQPGDVLVVPLPVREISTRLIRKKAERVTNLHWNPILGTIESPWCEGCSTPAHPLFLCDDRVHFLCKSCADLCQCCGKHFCRACRPRCKCGGS